MSRRKIKAGSTSQILPVFIQDTSSTTGAGLGSLVYNTASLAAKYRRQGDSSWTSITLVTATAGTFTSGGFVADGGSVTGGYEIGLPNAMLAAGATWAQLQIYGAANMLAVLVEFELDAVDYQDTVRFGLTALPNVANGSAGGLIVQGTGTTGIDVSSGKVLLQATQTGVTIPTVTNLTNAPTNGDFTATMKASITTAVPTAAAISTQVQTDLGTGAALTSLAPASTALSTAVWTTTIAGRIDAAISTRLASASYTAPLDASGVRNAVGLASANLDTQLDALPTAAEISTQMQSDLGTGAALTSLASQSSVNTLAGYVDTEVAAIKAKTDNLPAAPAAVGDIPTAIQNANALLGLADGIETGLTPLQCFRLIVSATAGKVSGADGTTVTFRDIADTKDRIVATVDSDGNRTAITRDLT